jgi:multiple sugar transport system ATP-binding protein
MDEPLSSLNPELNPRLRKEILRLHAQLSFTLLYVTHSHDEAFEIGTRVILMREGQIERMGSPVEIRREIAPGRRCVPLQLIFRFRR